MRREQRGSEEAREPRERSEEARERGSARE